MQIDHELLPLVEILKHLRRRNKLLIAILFGSFAHGKKHKRSDIDLATYLKTEDGKEAIEITDKILMSVERDINLLRLDDEEESPFIIQEALKGIHLVEPDTDILYKISHRILHESENIRFRRGLKIG